MNLQLMHVTLISAFAAVMALVGDIVFRHRGS
jgi:hypothetical protein